MRCLEIFLHYQEESLIGVEKHFIFIEVHILWRNSVFSEVCSNQNAEAILANYILVKTFHELHRLHH